MMEVGVWRLGKERVGLRDDDVDIGVHVPLRDGAREGLCEGERWEGDEDIGVDH
jgi:hypothetical protein